MIDAIAPGDRDVVVMDTDPVGFGLKVTPSGRRVFFYRYRVGGRGTPERKVTIGLFGDITVDQARKRARELAGQRAAGADPGAQLRAAKEMAAEVERVRKATLCGDLVVAYIAGKKSRTRRWQEEERLLAHDFLPRFRSRPVATITRAELVGLVDEVEQRAPATARALFASLRPFLKWCVRRGDLAQSPLEGVAAPKPLPSRERTLTDTELHLLWRATADLGFPFGPVFRLLLLTGQRRSEVAGMAWAEVDLNSGVWRLPRERSKNGASHEVDLAPLALEIVSAQPRVSDLIFSTNGTSPPSGFGHAQARLVAKLDALAALEGLPKPEPWRTHDLRRTAASGMAALGVAPHVTERVLNHISGTQGGLIRVYQRHEYRAERREALLRWEARVREIIEVRNEL